MYIYDLKLNLKKPKQTNDDILRKKNEEFYYVILPLL